MNVFLQEIVQQNPGLSVNSNLLNEKRHPIKTTERYRPTDNIELARLLNARGWYITSYREVKAHKSEDQDFKPYLARFENLTFPNVPGEGRFQILHRDAKDGTHSYEFMLGFYRTDSDECFVVGESSFEPIKVKHKGSIPLKAELIDEVITRLLKTFPIVFKKIEQMKTTKLSEKQKQQFAKAAIGIRAGEEDEGVMNPSEVLTPFDPSTQGNSLWAVFNTVQSNLLRCPVGINISTKSGKTRKARAIKNINREVTIAKALWNLAESYLTDKD